MINRITLVIPNLNAGGAERVASMLANHWARKGVLVTILIFSEKDAVPFFELDAKVRCMPLDLAKPSRNLIAAINHNARRIFRLRKAILSTRPDVVVSFLLETNVITLLANLAGKIPTIVTERTDPYDHSAPVVWKFLRKLVYGRADTIVVLTERAKRYFGKSALTVVIPNPIVFEEDADMSGLALEQPFIVSIGRLDREKKTASAIQAFAQLSHKHPDWRLVIVGDGELRGELEDIAMRYGLSERVIFTGTMRSIQSILNQAEIFVSASTLEGFPMAICEAMVSRLPVIAAKYNDSIYEIIEDGVNGIVVKPDDVDELKTAIDDLIRRPDKRRRLGNAARQIQQRFGLNAVAKKWDALFYQLVGCSTMEVEGQQRLT